MSSPADWSDLRRAMPVAARWAYFDHAAVAPMSLPARQAMDRYARESSESGTASWPHWSRQVELARECGARLLESAPDELAFIPNTTAGITCVAENFPWRPGDNLVTLADEFPSNLYPWLNLERLGVTVRQVRPAQPPGWQPAELLAACDARTRLISVSWVGYASGWRADVEGLVEAAHRRKIAVFLDAIQGLGVFPFSVTQTPVDFLAADGHKWLLGPEGAGLLYIRRDWLPRFGATPAGWNSMRHRFDFNHIEMAPRNAAARYEAGTNNQAGIHALAASMQLLEQAGWGPRRSRVAERVLDLADSLAEQLTARGAEVLRPGPRERTSGIVSFQTAEEPSAVRQRCLEQEVTLSCRAGRLRASVHAYNNEADLERLLAAVLKDG